MDAGPELGSKHLWVCVYHCRLRDAIVVKKCNINTYMWIREIANPVGWILFIFSTKFVSTVNVLALLHEHLVGVWRFPCLVYFLLEGLLSIFNSQSIKVCKNQTLKISLCILASMDCPQPIHGYIHVKEDAWHHLLREVPTSFCARRPEQQSQRCTVWIQSTAPSVLLLARITFVKTPNSKEGLTSKLLECFCCCRTRAQECC